MYSSTSWFAFIHFLKAALLYCCKNVQILENPSAVSSDVECRSGGQDFHASLSSYMPLGWSILGNRTFAKNHFFKPLHAFLHPSYHVRMQHHTFGCTVDTAITVSRGTAPNTHFCLYIHTSKHCFCGVKKHHMHDSLDAFKCL